MSYRNLLATLAATGLALATGAAFGAWEINLPEPVSPVTRDIFNLHMLTAGVATVIMIIISAVVIYALWKFRKSTGYEADQEFHRSWFGNWAWVLVPVVVLGIDLSIAGSAARTFNLVEDYSEPDMTVKVVGSQWKWAYEYLDFRPDIVVMGKPMGNGLPIAAAMSGSGAGGGERGVPPV